MPILVSCRCGAEYELKDEFRGALVQCPTCGASQRAGALTAESDADPAFDRDIFLLRQKALAINEKYSVSDEHGRAILYVERPRHFLRNLLALLGGMAAAFAAASVLLAAAGAAGVMRREQQPNDVVVAIVSLLLPIVFVGVLWVVASLLSTRRHVGFYRDESRRQRVLEVLQDRKLTDPIQTFTLRDATGRELASLRKNWLFNIVRKQWKVFTPSGELLVVVKEDSIILSLLRRVLGPLFGLLRTNFVFMHHNGLTRLGEFKRKMTILDRYVLDLTADRSRRLDRRIALAMGVMLDTGERR